MGCIAKLFDFIVKEPFGSMRGELRGAGTALIVLIA
jgi:hypothetical protein